MASFVGIQCFAVVLLTSANVIAGNNNDNNDITKLALVEVVVGGSGQIVQERPAVADKPARRLRKVCTVYIRAVGL